MEYIAKVQTPSDTRNGLTPEVILRKVFLTTKLFSKRYVFLRANTRFKVNSCNLLVYPFFFLFHTSVVEI